MRKYIVTHLDGPTFETEAVDEQQARQLAMIARYGETPDAVVPHAPYYKGKGLYVERIK